MDEAKAILNIKLFDGNGENKLIWHPSSNGRYSVKGAYRAMAERISRFGPHKKIWKSSLLPRVCHFAWSLCCDILPTTSNIARRLNSPDTSCKREMLALKDCSNAKLALLP